MRAWHCKLAQTILPSLPFDVKLDSVSARASQKHPIIYSSSGMLTANQIVGKPERHTSASPQNCKRVVEQKEREKSNFEVWRETTAVINISVRWCTYRNQRPGTFIKVRQG